MAACRAAMICGICGSLRFPRMITSNASLSDGCKVIFIHVSSFLMLLDIVYQMGAAASRKIP